MKRKRIYHPTAKECLQCIGWALLVYIVFMALLFISMPGKAQSVTRKGNTFIQAPSKSPIKKDSATLTGYFYMSADGTKYPIYMSSSGKCFIWRTSSKTGKQYKQYLPEVTKQLNGK